MEEFKMKKSTKANSYMLHKQTSPYGWLSEKIKVLGARAA